MQYTPITLGTLHIDLAIKLATTKELKTLNKQWQRSLIATRLSMKGGTGDGCRGSSDSVSIG